MKLPVTFCFPRKLCTVGEVHACVLLMYKPEL